MSVGDTGSAFELVRQGITVKPGYRTRIKVIQSQVVATEALESVSIGSRNCRFSKENENMRLFQNYSLEACQFECAVKNSRAKCQCIPWDFPRTDEEYNSTGICDLFGSYCFLEAMKNVSNYVDKGCNCINDCQGISFTVFETTEELKPAELCQEVHIQSMLKVNHHAPLIQFVY